MKLNIRGRKWTIKVLPSKEFIKTHGKSTGAITRFKFRDIIFDKTELTIQTIIHELIHAYMSESHLQSATRLKVIDYEEIVCETLSEYIYEILRQAEYINSKFNRLNKLRPPAEN